MNVPELFRLRLQSLVARGLGASEIATRVGLAAASEVWGGDAPRDRPAWYLWLRDAPGAWQLELVEAERIGEAGGAAIVGRFTVRHYPSPADPRFGRFSADERRIAAGSLDRTGTPRIELASSIPDALFTVGSVDWALDLDGGAALFAAASLDRLRTCDERGAVVRDVPGWGLTFPIFSLLAGLYAQVERRAASRLLVARQPGFEWVEREGGSDHREVPETVQGEASLLFPPVFAGREGGALLRDGPRARDAEVVVDVAFRAGAHPPHEGEGDPRFQVRVSHAWFGGDAHPADRIMCAC